MLVEKKGSIPRWRSIVEFLRVAGIIFSGLVSLIIFLFFAIAIFGTGYSLSGNVAIVPVRGEIVIGDSGGVFGSSSFATSDDITGWIDDAVSNNDVKAIILDIDSPGGSPVASKRIVESVKNARSAGKNVIGVIGETGASGAYWIASSADIILVDELSITGSIGVLGSYLDFSGFLNDNNVSYQRLVAGDLKDAGSPFKELTPKERQKIQEKIDLIYDFFVADVAKNRKMSFDDVRKLSDGFIFLGSESVKNGLADKIGNVKSAEVLLQERLGVPVESFRYEKSKGFFDALAGVLNNFGFTIGKGIGSSLSSDDGIVVRT
ncbi:signal peptide peptidase SppA [Candidatus Woesearchaeota archaeon]|nr:signal peptide peptidase SppA [Candidatus Woesearchaeota archaeon]